VRLAEFGTVYRWEQSGELNGMTRVRGFTQDDAHLFCTPEQVGHELLGCLSLVKIIFDVLGMKDYRVRVGLRDPDSAKYTGDPANWDKAEEACREAAKSLGVPFSEEPGEAAFYGPKIDFVVKDVIGREWQLGTVQVDYNLPERFDLGYIGPDNQRHRPVMIHRAPFGSMERFCGVLIEHFAGAFPTVAQPRAGARPAHQREEQRLRPGGLRPADRDGAALVRGRLGQPSAGQDQGWFGDEGPVPPGGRPPGRGDALRVRPRVRRGERPGPDPAGCVRLGRSRGVPHPRQGHGPGRDAGPRRSLNRPWTNGKSDA
jgi:hypothetical protein